MRSPFDRFNVTNEMPKIRRRDLAESSVVEEGLNL